MPIEQVVAFRASNGVCYESKAAAYREEVVAMYNLLPKVGKRGFSIVEMERLLSEVAQWRDHARTTLHKMSEEVEDDRMIDRVRTAFGKLVGEIDTWIDEVELLAKQMKGEIDPDAKKDLAHRKGKI